MKKTWIVSLNFFAAASILFIVFFSWQYLTIGTTHLRADYSIFYHTLNAHGPVYQKYYARYVDQSPQSAPQLAINLNTPTMNIILKGLLNVSSNISLTVLMWTVLSVLFSMLSIYLLMSYYGSNQLQYLLPLTWLFFISWPSIYAQVGGEVSFIALPVLCAAFLLGHQKKWQVMAAALGLLASLKIFFLVFIVGFLIRREWKLAAIFIASFLVFFFAPMIYFSWQDYLKFFQLPNDSQVFISHSGFSMNGALLGFVLNSLSFFHKPVTLTQLHVIVGSVSAYLLFRACVYYYRYLHYLPDYIYELSFSFFVVLALLLSPLAWVYYYIYLVIPVLTLLKINRQYKFSTLFYILFALACFLPMLSWISPVNFAVLIVRQYSAFADLIVWMVCLHLASNAVKNKEKKMASAPMVSVGILMTSSLLTIILLLCNYGFPHYFTIDKKAYEKENSPGLWISE